MGHSVKYGLIGCGMMGQEHIRNVALLKEATISVVYDPVQDLAEHAAQMCGGARVAQSIDDLLAEPDLDALVIVSPNHMHLEQLEQIIATRPLPILVEKPLYTDPDHAARVQALADAVDVPIWVAMEYRYMPPIAKLVADAQEVTGGIKMLTIREHRFPFLPKIGDWNRFNANTGGTLVEKCCHFFDLMRLVLQAEPVQVMASAGQEVNHLNETYDGQTPDIWDCGYVIVDFDNGARAMLELSMFAEGSRYQEEVSAVGPKAKIEAQVPGPGRFWPAHLGPAPTPQVTVSPRSPQGPITLDVPVDPDLLEAGDHNGSTFYQHQKFLAVVQGSGEVEVTLQDGAKAVAMGMAAQQSARESTVIKL
ncbi:Gfo/Idh/MocA family protein [Algirhabdus cladophorae]|uniref:Gfo/Idh/MocA family protein n=1 Tax=Algirhabdus cladophorae TaxID=3377108 RepID=UPI003B84737C